MTNNDKTKMSERSVNLNINNNFLSQSYSNGIIKIIGDNNQFCNFEIPQKIMEVRKQTWNELFTKYSEKSGNIELNIETLEPEEKFSETETEKRMPMRKSANIIQYWINTGNLPYKVIPNMNKSNESGSSISEKNITLSPYFQLSNQANKNDKQQYKNNSSYSSVDTAAYILSNTNTTNRVDTKAIIENVNHIQFLENNSIEDIVTLCNDRIKNTRNTKVEQMAHNNNDKVNILTALSLPMEYSALKTNNQLNTSARISENLIQSDTSSDSLFCNKTYRINASNNNKNLYAQNINDAIYVSEQFNNTSKQLSENNDSSTSFHSKITKKNTSNQDPTSLNIIISNTITKDTDMTSFNYKKLYTNRDSPVDLVCMERRIKKLPKRQNLHPALNSSSEIKDETFLINNSKFKHPFFFSNEISKKNDKKRKTRKRKRSKKHSPEEIKKSCSENSIGNSFLTSPLNSSNKLDICNNILHKKYQNANTSIENETHKQDSVLCNLNPIVLLKKHSPSLSGYKLYKNNNTPQENNIPNIKRAHCSKTLNDCTIAKCELESLKSNESTILIVPCSESASEDLLSLNKSSCKSVKHKSSASKIKKKINSQLPHLNNIYTKLNMDLYVVLKRLPESTVKYYTNRIVKSQDLNMEDTSAICQESLLNESGTHSYNTCGVKKKDHVKLRELKVVLEKLPTDIYFKKKCKNITNINISAEEKNKNVNEISQNASLHNNTKQSEIITQISTRENVDKTTRTRKINSDYLLKTFHEFKEKDDKINDISPRQIFDENQSVRSNIMSQHKNRNNQINEKQQSNYSVLTFISSDEDNLTQLIQPIKKKSRVLTTDRTLNEINTIEKNLYDKTELININKNKSCKNLNKILSLNKTTSRDSDESMEEKQSKIVRKFSRSNETLRRASSSMYNNKELSLFPSESDSDAAENIDNRKEKYSFTNDSKYRNKNSKKHLTTTIKKDEIDGRKNKSVLYFQTETYIVDSSDPEECNNTTLIPKKVSSTNHNSRYRSYTRNKRSFKDSAVKKRDRKQLKSPLNTSVEKHNVPHQCTLRNKPKSITDKHVNGRSVISINEEFDNNIILNTNNTTKNRLHSSVKNNIKNKFAQENNTISSTSLETDFNSSTENKRITKKPNFKNSLVTQSNESVKSTQILTFQTKTYCDSDSSEFS